MTLRAAPVVSAPASMVPPAATSPLAFWITTALVLLLGIALRVYPSSTMRSVGYDEILYRAYVHVLDARGLIGYDVASGAYLMSQSRPAAKAELPPTRFLYIFCGYLWQQARFGDAPPVNLREVGAFDRDPALQSLRAVSALFSIFFLGMAGVIAWRMAGRLAGLAVWALIACAPLQLHMSQHAMIDGFFAFWATLSLWALWENLRRPGSRGWLGVYGAALFCMVLTKENAFFVFCALNGLMVLNRWAKWGVVGRPLVVVTFLAPVLAAGFLTLLAGGPGNLVTIYRLLVTNAQHLDYAIETGDGPWYRYLVDLMVLSPVVLCFAIAAAFRSWREENWVPFVLGFVALTYLLMCNVRYGMNLRYAIIWDLPLCLLAFAQITWSARGAGAWARYVVPTLVALVCLHELHQYRVFFVQESLYELGPFDLLHAVKILK